MASTTVTSTSTTTSSFEQLSAAANAVAASAAAASNQQPPASGNSANSIAAAAAVAMTDHHHGSVVVSRKHVELSLELKRRLIQEHEHGVPFTLLGKKYHIATSTAANIWRKKDFFLRSRMSGSRKRCNDRSKYKIVNQVTALFVKSMLEKNHKIDGEVIKRFARTAAAQCNFKDFHGSNGWLDSFKKRENVCWVRRRGGASGAQQGSAGCGGQNQQHPTATGSHGEAGLSRPSSPNQCLAAFQQQHQQDAMHHMQQSPPSSNSLNNGNQVDQSCLESVLESLINSSSQMDNSASSSLGCPRCKWNAAALTVTALCSSDSIHERDNEIEGWFHRIPWLCHIFENNILPLEGGGGGAPNGLQNNSSSQSTSGQSSSNNSSANTSTASLSSIAQSSLMVGELAEAGGLHKAMCGAQQQQQLQQASHQIPMSICGQDDVDTMMMRRNESSHQIEILIKQEPLDPQDQQEHQQQPQQLQRSNNSMCNLQQQQQQMQQMPMSICGQEEVDMMMMRRNESSHQMEIMMGNPSTPEQQQHQLQQRDQQLELEQLERQQQERMEQQQQQLEQQQLELEQQQQALCCQMDNNCAGEPASCHCGNNIVTSDYNSDDQQEYYITTTPDGVVQRYLGDNQPGSGNNQSHDDLISYHDECCLGTHQHHLDNFQEQLGGVVLNSNGNSNDNGPVCSNCQDQASSSTSSSLQLIVASSDHYCPVAAAAAAVDAATSLIVNPNNQAPSTTSAPPTTNNGHCLNSQASQQQQPSLHHQHHHHHHNTSSSSSSSLAASCYIDEYEYENISTISHYQPVQLQQQQQPASNGGGSDTTASSSNCTSINQQQHLQ